MEICKKLYELEIRLLGIIRDKGDMWSLAVFCENSAGIVHVGGQILITLLNLCSESVVELVLRKGEVEVGSFEERVHCLCEGSVTGEFCKVIKVPVVGGGFVKLKVAGGLRVLKVDEGIVSKDRTGEFKEMEEIVRLSSKVDEKIKDMRKEIFEFYGVKDKDEEVEGRSVFGIFSEVQVEFEVNQDSDKDFLIELALALVQRVEILREEKDLVSVGLKCIGEFSESEKEKGKEKGKGKEEEEEGEGEEAMDIDRADNGLSEFIERISKEIQEGCAEMEKFCSRIEEIKVKIDEVRDNCEAISTENLLKHSECEEMKKQITELSEKISKSDQELYSMSQYLKVKTAKNPLNELNLKKSQASEEKYDLLTKLHQLTSELDDILLENTDLQTQIEILDTQKPQLPTPLTKPEKNIENFKEDFKSLCHQSAKNTLNSAISITDLETFTSYLKREIGHSKYKLTTKDSEHQSVQTKLNFLQTANKSAEKLIEKELALPPKSLLQDLLISTKSYDTVLNEMDFLSNLILLQTKTWVNESCLRSQLSQRLKDLNS